jgi:hypothetical protein
MGGKLGRSYLNERRDYAVFRFPLAVKIYCSHFRLSHIADSPSDNVLLSGLRRIGFKIIFSKKDTFFTGGYPV